MYAAFVGWLCHIRIFPPWLILLLLSPMYVGGVKLVIIIGEPLFLHVATLTGFMLCCSVYVPGL